MDIKTLLRLSQLIKVMLYQRIDIQDFALMGQGTGVPRPRIAD